MKDIKTAHNELEAAKIALKQKFIGIDATIDSVVDKMSAWYTMPDLMTRPTIINLWGLTGVGKTDLIRSLIKELKFNDRYLEIQMCQKPTDYESDICEKLLTSQIEPDMAGIMLLDEIQRFRTVDEEGKERSGSHYQDLWMLLSDGKFASTDTKKQLHEVMLDTMFYSERNKGKSMDDEDEDDDEFNPHVAKKEELVKKPKTYKKNHWEASRLKRVLKCAEPIEDIMKWDQDTCMNRITAALNDPLFNTEINYSKLLIFISGNLDEAFVEANSVGEVDRDADEVRKKTEKVSIVTIKKALMQRFKPEQIARFGNSHVICPSLSKDTFEKLISKRLSMYEGMVNKILGKSSFSFSPEINKMIFNNGVFPMQGVRPVYSTIDDFFNTCVPPIVMKSLENNNDHINVKYNFDTNDVVAIIGNEVLNIKYVGCIDHIRAKNRNDRSAMYCTAVHECGHALLHVLLYGTVPEMVTCNVTSVSANGYVIPNINENIENKNTSRALISIMYGGYVAEQIIFGKNHVSNGSSSDIFNATKIAGRYLMRFGHDSESFIVSCNGDDANSDLNNDNSEKLNNKINVLVRDGKEDAFEILSNNVGLLIKLIDTLLVKEKMNKEELEEFFKNENVEIISSEPDYEAMYNAFRISRLPNQT